MISMSFLFTIFMSFYFLCFDMRFLFNFDSIYIQFVDLLLFF